MASRQTTDATGDLAERGLSYAKDQWGDLIAQTEDYVRANPTRSLLYGLGAGFLLDRLPIFRIVGMVVRLLFKALKPALLVYAVTRLYQMVQEEE